jgi:hypothetical protein
MKNQLLGPETITPQDQVVVLTGLVEKDGGFEAHLDVRHPYDGNTYTHTFTVPREVDPLHPVWESLDREFQRLFPRRENMLAYRDTAKTLILEAVYALTKKPPPKVEKKEADGG